MVKAELQDEWTLKAKNILKAELKRKGVTYRQLGDAIGESERNLNNKISRGGFTAGYFLRCLDAIGVKSLSLD